MIKMLSVALSLVPVIGMAQPTINAITPELATVGTSININGSGFNAIAANNTVYFGQVKASVLSATASTLNVQVPSGAAYGPLQVYNNGLLGTSAKSFNPTFAGGLLNSVTFQPMTNFPAGLSPYGVCIHDIDMDGKPDIINTNYYAQGISIHRNSSAGNIFALDAALAVTGNSAPITAKAGDMDGDGKPDLVSADFGSAGVSIFRNQSTPGNLNVDNGILFNTAAGPYDVELSDLDGDGKLDVVTPNYYVANIVILRNTSSPGNFSFAPGLTLTASYEPISVVCRDFDGDGKQDIALAMSYNTQVAVYKNQSTPGVLSFDAPIFYSAGPYPYHICSGDLDGDGKTDLAVASYGSSSASVFRNISTAGTIDFAALQQIPMANTQEVLAIADIDGDGKPDLAAAQTGSSTIAAARNISVPGSIAFDIPYLFGTDNAPRWLAMGDLNADGKPDAVTANNGGVNNISVLINQAGAFPLPIQDFKWQLGRENLMDKIDWQYKHDESGSKFIIEVSADALHFKTVAEVPAHSGALLQSETYYTVPAFEGRRSYRIRGVDADGHEFLRSGVLSLQDDHTLPAVQVYPNPAVHTDVVTAIAKGIHNTIWTLWSATGQCVQKGQIDANAHSFQWTVPVQNLPAGIYHLKVADRNIPLEILR
jgi:hypothetical protein